MWQSGDIAEPVAKQKAFETEMIPHMSSLYNFAFMLARNSDDAWDLVQETYTKAFTYFDKYRRGSNAKAWLFRILRNSYINLYRYRLREGERINYESVDERSSFAESFSSMPNHWQPGSVGDLFEDEVAEALQNLEQDYRTVIILCDLEKYSYAEVAKLVEIPIGTVRSRLHRGRRVLRSKLRNYALKHGIEVAHKAPVGGHLASDRTERSGQST